MPKRTAFTPELVKFLNRIPAARYKREEGLPDGLDLSFAKPKRKKNVPSENDETKSFRFSPGLTLLLGDQLRHQQGIQDDIETTL